MANSFDTARSNVDGIYKNLIPIAEDITGKYCANVNKIVAEIKENVEVLNNEQIRNYMLLLATEAYSLAEVRDRSDFKKECATTLMKEQQAKSFNLATGTQESRKNSAILDSENEQLTNMLYGLVASLFKSKVDSVYRLIDMLKNVLISRNAEAKLNSQIKDTRQEI